MHVLLKIINVLILRKRERIVAMVAREDLPDVVRVRSLQFTV